MSRSKLVKDSVKFLSGTMVARIAGLLRGLCVPFFLVEPASYGLWQLILVVWQYGMYLHFGSFELLNRELPGLQVQGKAQERLQILTQSFWGTMFFGVIAATCIAIWPIPADAEIVEGRRSVMLYCAIGIIAMQVVNYHGVCFRGRSQFGKVSMVSASMALLGLPLGLGGAWQWGVQGLAGGVALSMTLCALGGFIWNAAPPLRLNFPGFFHLSKRGFPLSFHIFLTGAIPTIGPLVSASLLGLGATGHLGIAVLFGSMAVIFSQTIGTVMYPKFLEAVATGKEFSAIAEMFHRTVKAVSVLAPFVVCCGMILVAPVLHYLLPQYEQSLPLCYLLLASSFFHSFTTVLMFIAQAMRRHTVISRVLGVGIILAVSAAVVAVKLGGGIFEMSVALLIVNSLVGTVVLIGGVVLSGVKGRPLTQTLFRIFRPGLVLGAVTFALIISPMDGDSAIEAFGFAGLKLAILLAVVAPMAWAYVKQSKLGPAVP